MHTPEEIIIPGSRAIGYRRIIPDDSIASISRCCQQYSLNNIGLYYDLPDETVGIDRALHVAASPANNIRYLITPTIDHPTGGNQERYHRLIGALAATGLGLIITKPEPTLITVRSNT
ncbi:hypothetical protein [Actinomyces ruminicola]|uniref:Resolvase, N terminal domain n=1 Tax=Actinomyces ruminicola TaxID=332524 RepID=A0A1G9VXJ4_9ACTO|nr:hypothetical protein [Actinomyces ruminicola]SDM76666.1 hypothetical protein SAMN04487766_106176 [Actinomyces ruminicola]